jgi:hypothetical protein
MHPGSAASIVVDKIIDTQPALRGTLGIVPFYNDIWSFIHNFFLRYDIIPARQKICQVKSKNLIKVEKSLLSVISPIKIFQIEILSRLNALLCLDTIGLGKTLIQVPVAQQPRIDLLT